MRPTIPTNHRWDVKAAFTFALCVYFGVTVPGLRTIDLPVTEVEDPDVQVESIRVLSAGNVIITGCLLFVLALQVRFALSCNANLN